MALASAFLGEQENNGSGLLGPKLNWSIWPVAGDGAGLGADRQRGCESTPSWRSWPL